MALLRRDAAKPTGRRALMFDEQLIVIGTGIRTIGQMTMESVAWIKRADKALYIVSDPIAEEMIAPSLLRREQAAHPDLQRDDRPDAELCARRQARVPGGLWPSRRLRLSDA
jgi:hypothetical protein